MRGFRVWSNYWKKYATEAELYMDGSVDAIFEGDDGVPHHDNADLVVEFDTGLKDRSGEEIYGGDILLDDTGEPLEYWRVKYIWGKFVGECNLVSEDIFELRDLEVVGNVHENPELLEEEE